MVHNGIDKCFKCRNNIITYIRIKWISRENTVDHKNPYMNDKDDFPAYLYEYISSVCLLSW